MSTCWSNVLSFSEHSGRKFLGIYVVTGHKLHCISQEWNISSFNMNYTLTIDRSHVHRPKFQLEMIISEFKYILRLSHEVLNMMYFSFWHKWTEGKKWKQNLFLQCYIHCQYCTFWCNIFAKKQSRLLFSILNNYNIYKLFRITNTQNTYSQRHAWVHVFFLWFILNAGKGDENFSEPMIRKGKPIFLPHTYLPRAN